MNLKPSRRALVARRRATDGSPKALADDPRANDSAHPRAEGIDRGPTTYGDRAFSRFLRRAFLASAGLDDEDLDRPIIGVADTTSDFTTCHRQMPELVQAVRRGIAEAGGLAFTFPSMSLGEVFVSPTSMLYRNLLAMELEELIRSQPMDAVVLLGGCDKTVPGQLMGAISADKPFVSVVAGPMTSGRWRGERIGACTDCRRLWARGRAGELDDDDLLDARGALVPTSGTCTVMGTASTMACLAEALGVMLPGGASAPAPSGDRLRHAVESGRRVVALAREQVRPSTILSRASFANASRVLMAVGGSTNALVHLPAIAGRAGLSFTPDDIVEAGRGIPLLVDCAPSGRHYMDDFHDAGGVPTLLLVLRDRLDGEAQTVSGQTIGEIADVAQSPAAWQDTIRPFDAPVSSPGSLVVLRGNLAPDGAVIKVSAASPRLLQHRGRAVVFDSLEDVDDRLERVALTPDDVLVLRNIGPVGAGMPEAASIPIPADLARRGVRDLVRISDGRMSGTAFGTVVLHVSPEAAIGGPLSLVHDGDVIELDVSKRRLHLDVSEAELAVRRPASSFPVLPERGWRRLYAQAVEQAHLGADFDFLAARPSNPTARVDRATNDR